MTWRSGWRADHDADDHGHHDDENAIRHQAKY
jgi:hypothetical protein